VKLLTILGARPQFIKASVVSAVFRSHSEVQERIIHTGQHSDLNMSDIFFEELDLTPPDFYLGIHGGGHGAMTGRMLVELEKVLLKEKPDAVMVYGDTNSTLAGALAAAKLHIPVAHVEAGLRSFNRCMPEEVNRVLTDHLATWLFAPTNEAVRHLCQEGIESTRIHLAGDVMYDVALKHGHRADVRGCGIVERLGLQNRPYMLATIHRAENTDMPERLMVIIRAFKEIAGRMPVVWPMHPRTRGALDRCGLWAGLESQLILIAPQGYLDMVRLERHAAVIATDSGGVQKEAFFHRVPCVTLREETEWIELLELGWNKLVPPSSTQLVVSGVLEMVGRRGQEATPYGNGNAAMYIANTLSLLNE
jgi:UDP-GlcNAc3NAcA epimerase